MDGIMWLRLKGIRVVQYQFAVAEGMRGDVSSG
jgi:hypothetical protein